MSNDETTVEIIGTGGSSYSAVVLSKNR